MQTGPGVTVTVKREKLLQTLVELVQGLVELVQALAKHHCACEIRSHLVYLLVAKWLFTHCSEFTSHGVLQ